MKKDGNLHQDEGLPRLLPVFQTAIEPFMATAAQERSCDCTVKCADCRCARGGCSKDDGNRREQ